ALEGLDGLDGPPHGLFAPVLALALATSVGPGVPSPLLPARPMGSDRLAQPQLDAVTVPDIGRGEVAGENEPRGVAQTATLTPDPLLGHSSPRPPPTPVVVTDWLSSEPALGSGSRPRRTRRRRRRRCSRSPVPSRRPFRKD